MSAAPSGGAQPPRGGRKGIDWSGQPERDYVENGDSVTIIAERYGCSPQMVRKQRASRKWDDKRKARLDHVAATTDETSNATSATSAQDGGTKEGGPTSAEPPSGSSAETAPRARTEEQMERQERAFDLSVSGMTIRAIAKELGVCTNTVLEDLAHEQERRAQELGDRRRVELARAARTYELVIAQGFEKSKLNDQLLQKIINGYEGRVSDRSLDSVIKARERLDKIFTVEPLTRHKTREAKAKAEILQSEAALAGTGADTGPIQIAQRRLDPKLIPVDERGRALSDDVPAASEAS